MSSAQQSAKDGPPRWEDVGRAAEDFARRVARDAGKFAKRIEEHSSDFARDLSREWRRAGRRYRRSHACGGRGAEAPDVRRIFEDVRTILADVLEGVDDLIGGLFAEAPEGDESPASGWVRVVANRDTQCPSCAKSIVAGDEALMRRSGEGVEFRCAECGEPPADEPAG